MQTECHHKGGDQLSRFFPSMMGKKSVGLGYNITTVKLPWGRAYPPLFHPTTSYPLHKQGETVYYTPFSPQYNTNLKCAPHSFPHHRGKTLKRNPITKCHITSNSHVVIVCMVTMDTVVTIRLVKEHVPINLLPRQWWHLPSWCLSSLQALAYQLLQAASTEG